MEAEAGKSVVLPCNTDPQLDLRMVHWRKKGNEDADDKNVHLYRSNDDDLQDQNQDFKDLTSLFHSEISKGNCSLKLSRLTPAYSGTYMCRVNLRTNNDADHRTCSITLRGK